MTKPSLFGIVNSNRDFCIKDSWGKNQFNNAFPVALACYMSSRELKPVYFELDNELKLKKDYILVRELFGRDPLSDELYYAFEDRHSDFLKIVQGHLPGIDLVLKDNSNRECIKALEIKLTTLPDSTTYMLSDEKYGTEIVVRPDTIVYQALSIASNFTGNQEVLLNYLEHVHGSINDWGDKEEVSRNFPDIKNSLNTLLVENLNLQKPILMQPVWKTKSKSAILDENCLDLFVWSDYAFSKLFIRENDLQINRNNRTIIWLFLMLYDFASKGKINSRFIIDNYTYETKNDKAFAIAGNITNQLMTCDELTKPRICKNEIKNIILGGGQKYLSPERRFDGVIQSDVSLFE